MGKQRTSLLLLIGILIVLATTAKAEESQQINVSATPASITLPSPLPLTTQEQIVATTATYTPSPPGPALLEAITEANVRAEPDPESERLGTIRSGEVYAVIGRYYRWYQFQYNQSPSGTGWVFDELVNIAGDESRIVDLSENALPTADTAIAATTTMEAITLTPGGILTATAASSGIQLPVQPGSAPESIAGSQPDGAVQILPTFTYPPEVALVPPDNAYTSAIALDATPTLIPNSIAFSIAEGVPPLVPILLLGGVGLLGLFITSYKR